MREVRGMARLEFLRKEVSGSYSWKMSRGSYSQKNGKWWDVAYPNKRRIKGVNPNSDIDQDNKQQG